MVRTCKVRFALQSDLSTHALDENASCEERSQDAVHRVGRRRYARALSNG
jgi:hypothetical protein